MAQKPKPRNAGPYSGLSKNYKPVSKSTGTKAEKVVQGVGKRISQSKGAATVRALTDSKLTPAQRVAAVQRAISPFGGTISSSEKEKLKKQFGEYVIAYKTSPGRIARTAKASSKKK
jgi:hypothetical protein